MITRRDALVGLLALPGALKSVGAAEDQQQILGPTVFHWDEMKVVKTKVVRSVTLQAANGHAGPVGDAREHAESWPHVASTPPSRE